jgi:4-amino-4-deoxy-L-arabinose transferase-like glycosyltransferase
VAHQLSKEASRRVSTPQTRVSAPRIGIAAILLAFFLYFFRLSGTGLFDPDEPRYAAIGREMARSGDWITPRLWGQPWFEKSPWLYWMTAAGFRLGLNEELAPRLPVAFLSVAFLALFYWSLRREFGARPALFSTIILGTSAGWLAYSYKAVTDLPMSVFFSAAMLAGMVWLRTGAKRSLILAAGLLGVAVLAKGFVPLALAIPFAWIARRRMREMLSVSVVLTFLAVAAPWYALCWARNGPVFWRTIFWEQQVGRFTSSALQHAQPVWFYLPVFAALLFPWTPAAALLFRRETYSDERRILLLLWLAWGLVFFSLATNKLPGYVLPLLPPAAALMGIGLFEANARWVVPASVAMLCLVGPVAAMLPQLLAGGLSRSHLPSWSFMWLLPLALVPVVWRVPRPTAVFLTATALTGGVIYIKFTSFPFIDAAYSARPLWRQIAAAPDSVCVEEIPRNWRLGLNYYSVTPLPDCAQTPRPVHVTQLPGGAPAISPH